MYSINNNPFTDFGILPGRAAGSNIALGGMLDMPARIGKTFHDWTGEQGVEPYVLESEIRHGGRDLIFSGYVAGTNSAHGVALLERFYEQLNSFDDLVPLVTPYGTHSVYIKDKIEGTPLAAGWNKIEIPFREPVPDLGIQIPTGTETNKPHIDGVALSRLKLFISTFKDHLNRAKIKEQEFTAWQHEGFQITQPEALEYEMELVGYADTFTGLKTNIARLQAMLAAPGLRTIKADAFTREVFNTKGFSVYDIKIADNLAVCRIKIPLMAAKAGTPVETAPFTFADNNQMASTLNEIINIRL